jgi:FkbM family methyltransferase
MNFLNKIKEKVLSVLLSRIKSSGYYAVRSLFDDLKFLINKENPVIIDGGANLGETTDEFLSQYENPTIHAFEANKNLADNLAKRLKDKSNVHIIAKALGNQNAKISFNISKNVSSSSFFEHTDLLKEYHGNIIGTEEIMSVPMVTLDSVFHGHGTIDLLKLDVEGYELEVLRGAKNILSNVRVIMTEVWFAGGYANAPYFSDMDLFLRENNFFLLNIYNPYVHKDMQLTTGDAVFINKKFFADRKHFG